MVSFYKTYTNHGYVFCTQGMKTLITKKLSVLQKLSEDCSPEILKLIVRENPFLLNGVAAPDEQSAFRFADLQQTTVEFINSVLMKPVDEDYDQTQSLLVLVLKFVENNYLYENVKLLIISGADFNIMCEPNTTPMHVLCRRINDSSVVDVLRLVLYEGKNSSTALQNEPENSVLNIGLWYTVCVSDKLNVVKLLLKFGAKPFIKTLIQSVRILYMESYQAMGLVKLILQYLLINHCKSNLLFNHSKSIVYYPSVDYDKILVETFITTSKNYEVIEFSDSWIRELIEYKNTLNSELIKMSKDEIDENMSLFSFISDRCSSGHSENENETLLCKVLTKLRCKPYKCCYDLVHASIDRNILLPLLCNLNISVKKPLSDKKIMLNPDTILHVASYLSKEDVINLTLAYWADQEQKSVNRCSYSNNECFEHKIIKKIKLHHSLYFISCKRIKLNK